MKSQKNLVIISVDALNQLDYDFIHTLPTFGSFLTDGAHSKEVTSVYPTVTYTCHTSISTGHYPQTHGIFNNELYNPEKATLQDWYWFEKDIKTPTFFDYAIKAGLTTASVLWPVMAGAKLTCNVPEIWSPDHSISRFKLFFNHGTKNMLWPVLKYKNLLRGTTQPYLDDFSEAIATYILEKNKPNVIAIHFTELDTVRHLYGLTSHESHTALKRIDTRIANLMKTVDRIGLSAQTNYVLLGDHGTHDFNKVIEINSLFKKENLLKTDKDNNITSWEAYACTCGGSCQIHVKKDAPSVVKRKIDVTLSHLSAMPNSPVKYVLSRHQAKTQYGLDGDFTYIVEAKDKHVFRNTVSGQLVHDSIEDEGTYIGDHGYSPTHPDQKTLFMMKGPSIKKGAVIDASLIIDEGPTFAALLGLKMEKVEGRVLDELLN
jgi:predicted AlkP superfamily pyrophosphatase or phosphodiesterase